MEANRFKKLILDRFQEHLQHDYEHYRQLHDLEGTDEQHLLTFLIDQNLIPSAYIQRYTILQEFERVFPQQEFHKTHTVHLLAHRFCIPERTVWSILKGVKGRKKGK